MRLRLYSLLLLLALLLAACGGSPASQPDSRTAVFVLVLNDVQFRPTEDEPLAPASVGLQLYVSGQAQSGSDGRARLDLAPEGTVVRIGPDTLFTLEALETDITNPLTRLGLLFGQVWIILAGGSLEVQTPFGLAAVRGSYMSVGFDAVQGMVVTCLEGHCALENDAGKVELTDGQVSTIAEEGAQPSPPEAMDEQGYQDWQEASPEAAALLSPDEPDEPRFTDTGEPIPEEAKGRLNTQPLTFTLTNNCTDPALSEVFGDWLWQFERLPDENGVGFTEHIVIPTGQTVSGSLPAGQYIVTDWFPNGEQHGPALTNSDDISLQVQNCPEGGQPPQPPSGP
ncbi:MAG: FecR family protein [Chloroflexota bacterium]